jgi:hypothetical protein
MTTRRKSPKRQESFAAGVGRGMRRAARTAREVGSGASRDFAHEKTRWRTEHRKARITNTLF